MSLKYFICPSGQKVQIKDCLSKCHKSEGRCLSLPTLMEIADTRPWTGSPSTTELLNGTRLSFLQITKNYAVSPYERAFALLGTQHHRRLEKIAEKINALSEERLQGEVSGILDLLVPDEMASDERYILMDYKTSGSFKVAKALGLVRRKVPDPSGEVYKTSGKWGKAGDTKMVTIYEPDESVVDMWDWELQVNNYRLMVQACGFPVSKMVIQATVRDGGTMVAQNRGIVENIYLIPVQRLADSYVQDYFSTKRVALLSALETGRMPAKCNSKENWDGKRCEGFCPVKEFCP